MVGGGGGGGGGVAESDGKSLQKGTEGKRGRGEGGGGEGMMPQQEMDEGWESRT